MTDQGLGVTARLMRTLFTILVLAVCWLATTLAVAASHGGTVLTPSAAPPGETIHATNLAAICGEITPDLDFVQLYRSEGTYTGDDVIFPAGALVEHERLVISYEGPDGEFVVPDVAPGTYYVYLVCAERELPQYVHDALLTVQAAQNPSPPPTDVAGSPAAAEPAQWAVIVVALFALVGGALVANRASRRRGISAAPRTSRADR